MAHNIMNRDAFASTKRAWHGLGKVVDKAMTSEEAIRLAKLDYNVVSNPVLYKDKNGNILEYPDRVVNFNEDSSKPFGIVSKDYKKVQNKEAFRFFDSIVGEGEAIFETAGALKDGQIAFVTAKLPEYIRVEGTDDITERYLLLTIGHDGKHSTQAMFTPIRVVCNNTLSAAISGNSNKVSIYHRGDTKSQLDQAHKVLGICNQLTEELSEVYTKMSKTKIDDKEALRMINRQFLTYKELKALESGTKYTEVLSTRKINTLKGIKNFFYNGIGQNLPHCKGTVYGMYNAVNGYFSNKQSKDIDKKVTSLYFGHYANIIDTTFKKSLELIK